jgi:predicted amidohydrolase YtcJ
MMQADLALIYGNVLTMNPSQPHVQAVAIRNDRIIHVGTNEEVKSYVGKYTKTINLEGKTVIPGFIDTHIHVADFGKFLIWVDLKDATSIQEMKRGVRRRGQKIPEDRWIIGHGLNLNNFCDKRPPNLQDLDEASPCNPVILYSQTGRVCVVNSKALELAGITKETKAPSGGTIERDPETGEPTGILRESATDLVWKKIPEPSEEEIFEAAILACDKIVEAGVTTVHWIATSPAEIPIVQKLIAENKLPLRVYTIIPTNFLEQKDNSILLGNSQFRVNVFADGFLSARTAALSEPYRDESTKGQLMYSQKKLDGLVAKAYKANISLAIHAMGDQAIEMTLNAFEKALTETPRKNHRYRIEHASLLNRELIQRIKKLELIVSIQPKVVSSEFSVWSAVDRLGAERARWLYPLKTLFKEGIRVTGGSDCPMEPLNPLLGIQAAVCRQYFPEEGLTVYEALQMYTINAAYASFEENLKGSIDEGKLADLTVLSDDPQTTPLDKLGDITVELTVVGGKVVFEA